MKRIISVLCALALCIGCCAFAEDMRAELPEVTLKVKEALNIGDEYTGFSSSNYNGRWDLYWSGDASEISVSCDGAGNIYNYYLYEYDYEYDGDYMPRYPSISAEELEATANGFLGRVIASENEGWIIEEIDSSLQHGTEARVNVQSRLTKHGAPTDITIDMTIDAASGAVNSFYRSDAYSTYAEFDGDMTEGIPAEEALELLKSRMGLELEYYETDADETARLMYMPSDNGRYVVRASDGEIINLEEAYRDYYGYEYAADTVNSMQDTGGGEVRKLTEAELEGISVYDDALSVNELDALLRELPELGLGDGFVITNASYYERGDRLVADIGYSRQLSAEEAAERNCEGSELYYDTRSLTVDAADGGLISLYSYYPGVRTDALDVDIDAVDAKAGEIVEKYFPGIADKLQLDHFSDNSYDYGWSRSRYYEFVRTHAGYPYRGNSVRFSLNVETGVIDDLYVNWDEDQEFAGHAPEEIISAEAAQEAYLAGFEFENAFVTLPEGKVSEWEVLYGLEYCWQMYDRGNIYAIDAVTGEVQTYSYDSGGFVYDDIDGHEHAEAIAMLGQYGIGFSGGQFMPGQAFTARDALVFIAQAAPYTYGENIEARDFDSLVSAAENLGAPELEGYAEEQVLTRGEFAGILACMSGYEKAAALTGIYDCGFADNDAIPEADYGMIAISYGLGLIDVDENGNINADAGLTRGDAAVIFHKLLSMK